MTTTSGTTTFTLDVDDIIEQAIEPLGGEHQTAETAKKARRKLNLLLIQMQNREIPLSKLDFTTVTLVSGTAEYTLDASVKDVLECSISKDGGNELGISRTGLREYQRFPIKDQANRPNTYITERKNDAVDLTFWPVPNETGYVAHLLVAKVVEDVTASYQKVDLPTRYLPLIIKWLTYEIAMATPAVGPDKLAIFRAARDEVMPDTFEEDRERGDFTVRPGGISGR
jgi:hypothetical protein